MKLDILEYTSNRGLPDEWQLEKSQLDRILEYIHQWENSLRFYYFASQLGQDTVVDLPQEIEKLKKRIDFIGLQKNSIQPQDCTRVVGIFLLGKQEIGDRFIQLITEDMQRLDYFISKIGIRDLSVQGVSLYKSLYVQEKDLNSITEQVSMSQGMFRALSLLIQVNCFLQSGQPGCIIIDDIGEGLNYQRSSALIKILIEKIEQATTDSVQLIMTTNDEFIMNGVPLEYWSVIDRTSGHVKLHNIFNAKDKIEEFKFIGLNNFDFFTSEFHKQEFSDDEE